ncbi:MAG: NAD(+) synthase [Oscillospiraceae bacterium]|nr:NAD(+) synthase [Oscillospiraceae bacterium]
MSFDAKKTAEAVTEWVRKYFEENASPDTKAIIGISGGKDSSVAAAVCVKALGKDRVVGVLMPQGVQSDIAFSELLVNTLGIKSYRVNIGQTVDTLMSEIATQVEPSRQARVNTPARIRMATLYAIAACENGRVINTCNLSEDYVGYSTKFGDSAGDVSPLSDLTVHEVIAIGDELGLPRELTHKVPIDGLSGLTDEDNLGFTYAVLDAYIRGEDDLSGDPETKERIDRLHRNNLHKLRLMPKFEYKPE